MPTLLRQLLQWWTDGDARRSNAPPALAGKWPDTAAWMARLVNQTRETGGARTQPPTVVVQPTRKSEQCR
jgi:hypothetical protein